MPPTLSPLTPARQPVSMRKMKKGNTQSPLPADGAAARCQRLTLSLPADVATAVDALAARKGAASRSALVADLLRAA
ncbi:MAG: ribbon-helix-helix protein, CopG family, partial [Kiritimatiellae bacterium]|nr:ribbon-helix-helix protein, CopG family [Kiritimatiellia bacterium]